MHYPLLPDMYESKQPAIGKKHIGNKGQLFIMALLTWRCGISSLDKSRQT